MSCKLKIPGYDPIIDGAVYSCSEKDADSESLLLLGKFRKDSIDDLLNHIVDMTHVVLHRGYEDLKSPVLSRIIELSAETKLAIANRQEWVLCEMKKHLDLGPESCYFLQLRAAIIPKDVLNRFPNLTKPESYHYLFDGSFDPPYGEFTCVDIVTSKDRVYPTKVINSMLNYHVTKSEIFILENGEPEIAREIVKPIYKAIVKQGLEHIWDGSASLTENYAIQTLEGLLLSGLKRPYTELDEQNFDRTEAEEK